MPGRPVISAWLAKSTTKLIGVGLLLLALAVSLAYSMHKIDALEARAASLAREERDAHWRAQIAESNAKVAQAQLEGTERVLQLEGRLAQTMAESLSFEKELEKKNAKLPNPNSCGLDHSRWRLLNTPR